MNKFHFIFYAAMLSFLLNGCSQILEPISISKKLGTPTKGSQEKFSINIKPLTFSNAKKANKDPYSRKLMQTGVGSKANVFNESEFLNSKFPDTPIHVEYIIGPGDTLSYAQLSEFIDTDTKWPSVISPANYLLGVGDELKFIRQNEITTQSATIDQQFRNTENTFVLSTEGTVGPDGNILLLGLGNITATNRSIEDVRNDVRNILIRNGLAPNFQLEIIKYASKKAYLTMSNNNNETIRINSVPISLREVVLGVGISHSTGNLAIITLTRNNEKFRTTAKQLLELNAPNVYIQDKDQIEIEIVDSQAINAKTIVGSQGNILLPKIGNIRAAGLSLSGLRFKISRILKEKGLKPNFQVEISDFNSKSVSIVQKGKGGTIIPLTEKNMTLRNIILNNKIVSSGGFAVITLRRGTKEFQMTQEEILDPNTKDIWLQNKDQIEYQGLSYKPGQVFALSGAGSAVILPIEPSKRETLADVLFVPGGALSNIMARRSEVYLLRGRSPSIAYHLDAQNVSRLLVAAQTELRPNDIIFAAERPIISFARTLSEIAPLRLLLRDIESGNIP
jgi:protein involved in polysaccharide export with SLBB domain